MQQFLFDCAFNNSDDIIHSTNKIILDIPVHVSSHMLRQDKIPLDTENLILFGL